MIYGIADVGSNPVRLSMDPATFLRKKKKYEIDP